MALCSSSIFDGCFTLKTVVFSNIAWLFKDPFFSFVRKIRGVNKMFWNKFGVKTCECSGVPCEGAGIAFFSGSTSATKRTNVKTSISWRKLARCTRHGRRLLRLFLWQKSKNWFLSQCHQVEDLSVLTVCYVIESK